MGLQSYYMRLGSMKVFSEKNYKQIVNSDKVAVVVFTSPFCHLCNKLKPILKKLEKRYKDVGFYVTDVNKEEKLTKLLVKEDGVPTGFIVKDGSIFKIKDPEKPDDNSWYSEKYLQELIEALQ